MQAVPRSSTSQHSALPEQDVEVMYSAYFLLVD